LKNFQPATGSRRPPIQLAATSAPARPPPRAQAQRLLPSSGPGLT
jgi:hypothetical protein